MSLPVLIIVAGIGVLALVLVAVGLLRGSRAGPRRAGNTKALVRSAERALAQNPKDVDALSVLGNVYFSEQNWEKAAAVYAKLLDLVAANPDIDEYTVLLRHGLSSMQLKNYQDAYRSLMLAWKERKDVFEINFNLGRLELMRKRYDRAAALLAKANECRPGHLPTMQSLGLAFVRLKRFSDAIDLLRRVVESEPDDRETLFYLGQAHYELGQQDQAGRIFRRLRADPTYGPRASLIAGSIHLKNRLYNEAEMDFQLGLKHDEIPPETLLELRYRLAATYFRKQEMENALRELGEIVKINPTYKDVAEQVERARELAGNKNLQTFLMSSASEFVGLARRIVTHYVSDAKTKILDITVNGSEAADVLAEIRAPKWEDTALFRMVRTTGQVGELVLRDLHSRMKDLHAGRGFCMTAGAFSEGAQSYVEARFIDLVEKDDLLKILRRVSAPG